MTRSPLASDAATHVPLGVGEAWRLTGRISPRRVVRAATVDDSGRPVNAYPLVHPVAGLVPRTPWAVHLADASGRYRLLCADLDARADPDAAARDADRLAGLLGELGVQPLVCASGPSGGRHVWLALKEAVDADLVAVLARLLKAWLPSLDVAPLLNPTSGCVRPPGAPHRLGGASRILTGSLSVLTGPSVTLADVHALVGRLAERVNATHPPAQPAPRPVAVDGRGLPYLPGVRRGLSPACQRLLESPVAGDASAVLWRILCGAAAARWRFAEVMELLSEPGLEHARTVRSGASRTARPSTGPASPTAVMPRQWTRAVHALAAKPSNPDQFGEDATFDGRATTVSLVVSGVQARADATPGRWGASRSGLGHRRVLDALCLYHLQAVRPDQVEADIRRLALTCGLDRETVRRALLALAADGWITRTHPSAGRRAAHWSVDPAGTIHSRISAALSQADPRPVGTGAALRHTLLDELTDRLQASGHDAFAGQGGLGIEAGSLFGRAHEPLDATAAARLMGWTIDHTSRVVARLASVGLIFVHEGVWRRAAAGRLDELAEEQGTIGRLHERADRYRLERELWAWWQAELTRRRAARAHPWSRRLRGTPPPTSGVVAWPAHPRRPSGRGDFAAARRALAARSASLAASSAAA